MEAYRNVEKRLAAARAFPKRSGYCGTLADPYYLAFEVVVQRIGKNPWITQRPPQERVAFVFDRTHLSGRAEGVYKRLLNTPGLTFHPRLGSLSFDDKRLILPLQAADFLAYETFKNLYDTKLKERPERWQFTEIKQLIAQIDWFDETRLNRLADKIAAAGKKVR